MSQALTHLLALLNLEKIEEGLFRGQSEDLGLRQVFGGQVVGQALYAAKETVAPAPDALPSETDIARKLAHLLPPQVKEKFLCDKPLEIRPVEFHNPLKGHVAEPTRQVWIRANGAVPEDLRTHQSLLGYASDFNFLPVALQPHGVGFLEPGMQVATIDHSMWFHRPFNINDWLLYSVESTSASSARGFVRGEFYTQDGTLVASTVQEGVMRNRNA